MEDASCGTKEQSGLNAKQGLFLFLEQFVDMNQVAASAILYVLDLLSNLRFFLLSAYSRYIASISWLKFLFTTCRLTFKVGVSSPSSIVNSRLRIANFLTVLAWASVVLT